MMLKSVSILLTAFVVAVTFGVGHPVVADDNPLRMIPTNNSLVIRARKPAAIVDKICSIADRLQAEFPSSDAPIEVKGWGQVVRESIEFDKIEESGVDVHRDWWGYISNPFGADASYAFILPLSDFEQFKTKRLEVDKTPFEVHGDWVLVGTLEEIDAIKKCIAGEMESIETRMSPEARTVFEQGDVGVMIDIRHLINTNLVMMLAAPEILKMFGGGGNIAFTNEQSKDFFQRLIDIAFQSFSSLEFTTLSIAIDQHDIRIDQYWGVREGSLLAKFFRDNPGSDMSILSNLPSSSAVFVGLHGNWKAFFRGVIQLVKWSAANNPKETIDAQIGLLSEYEKLNYGSVAFSYPMRPVDQGLLRSMSVIEVDRPDRTRELVLRTEELGDRLGPMKRNSVKRPQENLGDHEVDVKHLGSFFQMQQQGVPDPDVMSEVDKVLYGPEGNIERTVYLKDRVIQFHGGTKVRAAAAIRNAINTENGNREVDPHFLETRNKLGEKPNLIVMIETGTLAGTIISSYEQLYTPLMFGFFGMMNAGVGGAMPIMVGVEAAGMDNDDEAAEEETPNDAAKPADDADAKANEDDDEETEVMEAEVVRLVQPGVDIELQIKIDPEKLESLYENPSFIGFSMSFQPEGCRMRTVVPIRSIEQFVRAGRILMETFEGMINAEDGQGAMGIMPAEPDDE